jgi:hypothetical protein
VRDRRGRFARGRSGNPAGRPRGCRDHVNRAARLLLAGEAEALTRKAVEMALAGDPTALRRGQPPDFANASFAELFAWSLAQPAAE